MNPSLTNSKLEGQTPQSAFLLAKAQREGFLRHFGFRESPFGVTPDPEFLYWSRMHSAALQAMIASIESNLGFSVLLGKPGTGKTTLLFHLLAQYRESARTAFIFQTQCRTHDLIRHIASELELPAARRDEVYLHQKLNGMLLKEAHAGRKVLIVIDEAQNLQAPSLEAIRLLSDFETGPSKLLNVVLSGSPALGETLLTPELSQLAQRISTISRLEPLSVEDVKDYVRFRLAVVTSRATEGLFSSESLAEIAFRSEGVPRMINSICYRALILAYTQGRTSVSRELVKWAARDLDLSEPSSRDSRAAIQLPEDENSSLLNGIPFPVPREKHIPVNEGLASSELQRKPPAQTLVKTVPVTGIEAKSSAQTANTPLHVKKPDMNLRRQPVSAKADQGGRIRVPAIIRFKTIGWYRHRSTLLIAALALLAFGSWIGWNELRAKSGTSGGDSSVSQPEPLQPEAQLFLTPEVKYGVPQKSTQQPDRFAAAPSTDPNADSFPEIQAPLLIDAHPNSLPSKIGSQSLKPAEPLAPGNVVSMSKTPDNLAPLVAVGAPSLPRLEAPGIIGTSSPDATASPQPIKMIKPEYPLRARLWHIEGEVHVELTIGQNGNVQKVRRLSGNSILLQAAEQAVRQWQYPPSTGGQTPFPAVTRVQFNFKLNPEARNR